MTITGLRSGDLVEVRSPGEIAGTLDADGTLELLPFMPEMQAFAGKRFRVQRRLDKTCVEHRGQRRMAGTVTLEGVYCDGSAHDGCQRVCPLLWKEAWLKPAGEVDAGRGTHLHGHDSMPPLRTKRDSDHYFCQSTELLRATTELRTVSWDRCTLEWRSGNVGLGEAIKYLWVPLVIQAKSITLGISSVQPVGGGASTPTDALNLQPGEVVEVKQPDEIAATLDRGGRNRGLRFTTTMVPFCGKRYTVLGRADRIIDEISAEMRGLRNTVILDDVVCDGFTFLGGCSRLVYHLWREIWLRRV